jgi:hypothetical protein
MTMLPSGCYLGTWGARLYCLPKADRLPELCAAWFARHPNDCPSDFDEPLKTTFGLIAVTDAEFARLVHLEMSKFDN